MFEQLPALQIAIPLLGAPLCVLLRHPRLAWGVAMVCNLACTLVALALVMATREGEIIRYALGDWTAPTGIEYYICLLYTSPSPRDATLSRMPSSA